MINIRHKGMKVKFFLILFILVKYNIFPSEKIFNNTRNINKGYEELYLTTPYLYIPNINETYLNKVEENLTYLSLMPKKYDLSLQLRLLYPNEKLKSSYYSDYGEKITSDLVGALITAEYGINDSSSIGVVFGGAVGKTNFPTTIRLKSNLGYIGMFGRTKFQNIKFMLGAGVLYNSSETKISMKNIIDDTAMAYNMFFETKYQIPITSDISLINNIKVEPKINIGYSISHQGSVSNSLNTTKLSLKGDDFGNASVKLGVDLIKETVLRTGMKVNYIATLEAVSEFDSSKNIIGDIIEGTNKKRVETPLIKGGDILGKISFGAELAQCNGLTYNLKASTEIMKNKFNYEFGIGFGYRFATYIEDKEPEIDLDLKPVVKSVLKSKVKKVNFEKKTEIKKYVLYSEFGFDKTGIREENKKKLKRIIEEIEGRKKMVAIFIIGHTDSVGEAKYNLKLSRKRAEVVKNYLKSSLNNKYVTSIEVEARGESEPIATNKTASGRRKNRRVEIKIYE